MAARPEPHCSGAASSPPAARPPRRGRYFTIPQAVEAYPGVLDVKAHLDANRHEPLQGPGASVGMSRLTPRARLARSRPA